MTGEVTTRQMLEHATMAVEAASGIASVDIKDIDNVHVYRNGDPRSMTTLGELKTHYEAVVELRKAWSEAGLDHIFDEPVDS